MKNIKNIIIILVIILLILIAFGMYKSNSVLEKKAYDIDGNKIHQLEKENRELKDTLSKLEKEKEEKNIQKEGESENQNNNSQNIGETSTTNTKKTIIKVPKIFFDGTEDHIIFKKVEVPYTKAVLNAVYKELFKENSFHKDGVWNGLAFQSVAIQTTEVSPHTAVIKLVGSWRPAGDMSGFYFKYLINAAALQYKNIDAVKVYINDKVFDWCIDDESDGESGCPEEKQLWITTRSEHEKIGFL